MKRYYINGHNNYIFLKDDEHGEAYSYGLKYTGVVGQDIQERLIGQWSNWCVWNETNHKEITEEEAMLLLL